MKAFSQICTSTPCCCWMKWAVSFFVFCFFREQRRTPWKTFWFKFNNTTFLAVDFFLKIITSPLWGYVERINLESDRILWGPRTRTGTGVHRTVSSVFLSHNFIGHLQFWRQDWNWSIPLYVWTIVANDGHLVMPPWGSKGSLTDSLNSCLLSRDRPRMSDSCTKVTVSFCSLKMLRSIIEPD